MAKNSNLGLNPSSDIIIERFKSLNCFLLFLRGSWAQSRLRWNPIFRFCFLLMWNENCNMGLNPRSDIRIERFKSLNCFFTISKSFVSSKTDFVAVRFFASNSYSCGTEIVISASILARTSELSDSKAWIVFLPLLRGSWAHRLNLLMSDFSRLYPTHLEPKS